MESVTPYGRGQEYFNLQLEDPLQPVYQIEDNPFLFIMDCSEKKTIGCGRSSFFPKNHVSGFVYSMAQGQLHQYNWR